MKNAILSQALESLETTVPTALPTAAAPAPSAPTVSATTSTTPMISRENTDAVVEKKIEQLGRDKIVMNAPLSTIFTRALNIALSKKDVVTGKHEGLVAAGATQGEAVAVESQAQDAYYSAEARRIVEDALTTRPGGTGQSDKPEIPETLDTGGSGTRLQAEATNEETIRFFNDQSVDGIEPTFVFYQKVGERTDGGHENHWDQMKMIALNEKGGEGTYVVESVEIVVKTRKVEIQD